MRILIAYGTAHGQTRKIAEFLADRFRRQQQAVEVRDTGRMGQGPDPADFDATIVASPIRMGAYRRSVVRFIRRHRAALQAKPSALVSVSMAAANTANRDLALEELRKRVVRLSEKTDWIPVDVVHVAGGLPYTRYDFLTRAVMRRIGQAQGYDTDTTRDYEYTDWDALDRFARSFVASVGLHPPAPEDAAVAPAAVPVEERVAA